MWQYLAPGDQAVIRARLDDLGSAATVVPTVAHLRAEPTRRSEGAEHEFLVKLQAWPGGEDRCSG